MTVMAPGTTVVVNCVEPKEELWGVLLRLDAVGAVIRGLGLGSVKDWIGQEAHGVEAYVAPSTVFIPLHRIERIYVDESTSSAECYADSFTKATGGDVREALGAAAFLDDSTDDDG